MPGAAVPSFSFPRDDGGWQRDSAGLFRARRIVVKARAVKINPERRKGRSRGPKLPGSVHSNLKPQSLIRGIPVRQGNTISVVLVPRDQNKPEKEGRRSVSFV
jgi:hypothetical protein